MLTAESLPADRGLRVNPLQRRVRDYRGVAPEGFSLGGPLPIDLPRPPGLGSPFGAPRYLPLLYPAAATRVAFN